MDPNLSALAAYAGDYRMDLIKQLFNKLKLEAEGITLVTNVKSKLNLHKIIVGNGVKPFTGVFNAKDDISFKPRVLEVEKAQRDLQVFPDRYRGTYMEKLRGAGENAENMTIPFAETMWQAVIDQQGTELNTQTVYHGQGVDAFTAFDAGTAYTVGALVTFTQNNELRYFRANQSTSAGQTPTTHPAKWDWAGARAIVKGFGKILTEEIAAGSTVPVATGAVDATNAYDKFTQLYRSHVEPVKMGDYGKVTTLCSMTDYEALTDDYENKISKNFETINGVTYLAKTNQNNIIKPVSWLSGSRRLISTIPGNLWAGTDLLSDMNVIKTIEQMYHIDASIAFLLGFQIRDFEGMRISNQA